ncbi:MAG: S8 family serine peptidase [Sphingobacteriaceae bacterium]
MNKFMIVLAAMIVGSFSTQAQTKYWIKLKNKTGTPYSISTPSTFVTAKAIARRAAFSIPFDQTDLPVTPSYISQIDAVSGVTVLYASKWLNAVAVSVSNPSVLATINSFSFVQASDPTNKFKVVFEKTPEPDMSNSFQRAENTSAANYYGGAFWQARQLNVDCMHGYGYRGQGMTIAVLDAGFRNVNTVAAFDSLRTRNGISGTRDFVTGGNSVYEDDSHGMNVLSCMAALVPNVMVGTAPRADYWLLRTEDAATETPSEEYNWIRGAEFADSVGADMLTTSLGYTTFDNNTYDHAYSGLNGKTYPMSIASTMAARKGMFVLNSAGNEGGSAWQFVGVPADADSICTVGAIDSLGNVTGFSSKGPTSDGRIKPDLVARGGNSFLAFPSGGYGPGNGTSFSCPILAGAIACFWQRHSTFNNIKLLDTLRKTASNKLTPNNTRGWGIPDMCALHVGLKDISLVNNLFKVYPNPVTSKVNIEMNNMNGDALKIEIYNALGDVVLNTTSSQEKTQLDLSPLSNGVYFIKVTKRNESAFQRIVKQ